VRHLHKRPEQTFRQWLAGAVIVPLAAALLGIGGAVGVEAMKPGDCFLHQQEILQIYDHNPGEYQLLITEPDALADRCGSAKTIIQNANPIK
jgi:hypothetical protein